MGLIFSLELCYEDLSLMRFLELKRDGQIKRRADLLILREYGKEN
jgi:hypothetical protein